jgi:DNA mismatch repair protein MutS
MHKEYIEFYKTYSKKYGPKTAIFLMVGSFYELYDILNRETGETECNVREIVDILGIQLSSKKGDFSEKCDGLFAGFPDYVMHKWAGRLTSAGWTVVVINQVKDARGKVKERKVERILSPSTHIENAVSTDVPYVVTLYFDQGLASQPPSFGAAVLDLTTGSTHTYAGKGNGRPDIWTADDLVQLISVFQPKELLVYWRGINQVEDIFFRRMFGMTSSIPIHIYPVESYGSFAKEQVRTEYLQRVYSVRSLLPPKTYLGIQSEQEELALLFLLQFVEEHYPSIVKSFHRNEHWNPEAKLICGNHALTQLQMTGSQLQETVVGLFHKCITPMGKRAMKERLLSPYSQANQIRSRLEEVKEYMNWSESKVKSLERQLRFMFDLPRLHRKILCGFITPEEIVGLFHTYAAMDVIRKEITFHSCLQEPFEEEAWIRYQTVFRANFSEEKAYHAGKDVTPFVDEKYPGIASKEAQIKEVLQEVHDLRTEICTQAGINEEMIRMEEKEKEPFGFKASTITLQQLKKKIANLPEGSKISELKSGGWYDCTRLQQLNSKLLKLREDLQHLVHIHLPDACLEITMAGEHIWLPMEQWACQVDNTQCIGTISREHGYTCPIIEEVDAEQGSALEIENIRHPLVEASSSQVKYVKHNVQLGFNTINGWLVYGMNASGKSTLMKATGLCVLLAQAGCFVPAKRMRLKPFQSIYTRILNQDNLFAGLSSFAVEMSELRDILRNANQYTLVLGDELCAGTESISAQALVASGIQWLSSRHAKFIFATHLHDLPEYLDVTTLGVEVWHLHVDYDPVTKKLIYDRSLRPGNGSTLYGLEVARAMDLPFEFIEQALRNRHKMMGSKILQEATSSAWNSDIVRKECEVCKKQIVKELEVHHVQPRSSAINQILKDGTPMNDKHNLIVLCQTCHDKVHEDEIIIGDKQMTSDGPVREIKQGIMPEKKMKKSKWSEEDHETIMSTLQKYTSLSLKSIKALLHSKYGIEISEGVLGKIRKEC